MKNPLPLKYIESVVSAGSIRKAAEELFITASALNRRIIATEEELGVKIFERLPTGVRLTTAGEMYLHHIRTQHVDMERVKSQIADLSGIRRGHISIACSQAFLSSFLPKQIAIFRKEFPAVSFSVNIRDRSKAEESLVTFNADLALVFEPIKMDHFHTLAIITQPVLAVMNKNHPLATKTNLKLSDYIEYPLALPYSNYGIHHLIEKTLHKKMITIKPIIESDSFEFLRYYILNENLITFQIGLGIHQFEIDQGMICKDMTDANVPQGQVFLGQLKGRTLPVAAAKFAIQLQEALDHLDQPIDNLPPTGHFKTNTHK